jgi:hypothetical protein
LLILQTPKDGWFGTKKNRESFPFLSLSLFVCFYPRMRTVRLPRRGPIHRRRAWLANIGGFAVLFSLQLKDEEQEEGEEV